MKVWRATHRRHGQQQDQFYWILDDEAGPYRLRSDQGGLVPGPLGDDIPRVNGLAQDVASRFKRFKIAADVKLSPFAPGQYHPRIFRPRNLPSTGRTYTHSWLDSVSAVRNILIRLEDVFRIVEPRSQNDDAFGHEMRQLLIISCTEVESAWKSILKANNYLAPQNSRWTTNDYVKVLRPLHLDQWELALTRNPKYKKFSPFGAWTSAKPTTSLDWYNAYNQTKHDRENNLPDATLGRLIHAAGAAYLMVVAQFGQFGFSGQRIREIEVFQIAKWPTYSLEEHYAPPELLIGASWTALDYVF